jgi:ribonuclease HI
MISAKEEIYIYADGGSRGNPGPSASGVVILDKNKKVIKKFGEYLGEKTNNFAEYMALILALKKVKQVLGKDKISQIKINVFMDSELVVKQFLGQYKIQEPELQKLFIEVWNLKTDFGEIKFNHIPREKNKRADELVNETLDAELRSQRLF